MSMCHHCLDAVIDMVIIKAFSDVFHDIIDECRSVTSNGLRREPDSFWRFEIVELSWDCHWQNWDDFATISKGKVSDEVFYVRDARTNFRPSYYDEHGLNKYRMLPG